MEKLREALSAPSSRESSRAASRDRERARSNERERRIEERDHKRDDSEDRLIKELRDLPEARNTKELLLQVLANQNILNNRSKIPHEFDLHRFNATFQNDIENTDVGASPPK